MVTRAAGVEVAIRDRSGRLVQRLGHFTLAAPRRLVLSWDGRRLEPGTYVAVVRADGETALERFRI